jgi:hypothetical protein
MRMGIFGQAVLGPYERARHTDSACCRTTVGGKLNEVLATQCTSNYVCNQLVETSCRCAEQIREPAEVVGTLRYRCYS